MFISFSTFTFILISLLILILILPLEFTARRADRQKICDELLELKFNIDRGHLFLASI